jgi:hypothetical protein
VQGLGRALVVVGLVTVAVGLVLLLAPRVPWFGRLPGDILVERGRFTFYFPVVTSIVVSVVLTLLLNLFFRR